jgi:NAD+ diphosphatase
MSQLKSEHTSTHWFVIRDNEVLLNQQNMLPNDIEIEPIAHLFLRRFSLGMLHKTKYYCAEIDVDSYIPDSFQAVSLRQTLSLLNVDKYGISTKAYSVINWDKNHQHCSRCGVLTQQQIQDFERRCLSCELSFFPRISPSIIVLIKQGDHVLMARSPHFPPGVYGLIAGFVEAGESLEEAVHREVKEEVGVAIKNISYFGSQPWPFPDALMVAFVAEYESGDIIMDKNEIEDAGWYRYDDLPGRPSFVISIASTLLDSFIHSCKKE